MGANEVVLDLDPVFAKGGRLVHGVNFDTSPAG